MTYRIYAALLVTSMSVAANSQSYVLRDDTSTPNISTTFYPTGATILTGRKHASTFPSSGSASVVGEYQQYSVTQGIGVTDNQVGEYVGIEASGPNAGGALYGTNFLARLNASAPSLPFTGMEVNADNFKYDSGNTPGVDPLYGPSAIWATGVNIVGGGTKKLAAALAISSPPTKDGVTLGAMNRGISIYGAVAMHDLDLGSNADNAVRIGGTRQKATIDATAVLAGANTVAGLTTLAMPNQYAISAMGSNGTLRRLLQLDSNNNLVLGADAGLIVPGVSIVPTANNAQDLGSLSAAFRTTYTKGLVIGSATPATASTTCTVGTVTFDASYIYVCFATNSWKRSAITAW